MTAYYLKILPEYLEAIVRGDKRFEIRLDDRGGYKVRDELRLDEWFGEKYGHRSVTVRVTSVHSGYGLAPGFVCLGIEVVGFSGAIDVEGWLPPPGAVRYERATLTSAFRAQTEGTPAEPEGES